ncbi:MAG: alpha/beta hydrolase [Erysipelothrix sp.]|nr:alpha/beta hydrolase [Erysipelothrix sp.]
MRIEELILISNVDHHQMNGTIYRPAKVEKMVLLIHGMADHELRYKDVATQLVKENCLVLCPDLRGHGRSPHDSTMGYFAKSDGAFKMVRDLYQLVKQIQETYPVELILLGHSMGALFALDYLKRYPKDIKGVIISGTPAKNDLATIAKGLLNLVAKRKPKEPNVMIQNLMNKTFNKGIQNPTSDIDWVSANSMSRQMYQEDSLCGFPLTNAGYVDLFSLLESVYHTSKWRINDEELPIFILNGQHDPVSNSTETKSLLNKKGYENVTIYNYEASRHEIYFDNDHKKVLSDLIEIVKNLT